MPGLVATTSTPARKPFVRTHYVRTNNAKFSGHYVYPRMETVRAHALRSHQTRNLSRDFSQLIRIGSDTDREKRDSMKWKSQRDISIQTQYTQGYGSLSVSLSWGV